MALPGDAHLRSELLKHVSPEVRELIPHGLPNCLRRCGIAPADFPGSDADVSKIQEYMNTVSIHATTALAEARPQHATNLDNG